MSLRGLISTRDRSTRGRAPTPTSRAAGSDSGCGRVLPSWRASPRPGQSPSDSADAFQSVPPPSACSRGARRLPRRGSDSARACEAAAPAHAARPGCRAGPARLPRRRAALAFSRCTTASNRSHRTLFLDQGFSSVVILHI